MVKATSKTKKRVTKPLKPAPVKTTDDLLAEIEATKKTVSTEAGSTSSEQRKAAATVIPSADEKKRMLSELAERFGTSPEEIERSLSVNDPNQALVSPEDLQKQIEDEKPFTGPRVQVRLKFDYWMRPSDRLHWPNPRDNRASAGSLVMIPVPDARKLIDAGKAERTDKLPGER